MHDISTPFSVPHSPMSFVHIQDLHCLTFTYHKEIIFFPEADLQIQLMLKLSAFVNDKNNISYSYEISTEH